MTDKGTDGNSLHQVMDRCLYRLRTIWLFTVNDMKSIVLPETAFGILSALTGPLLTTNPTPNVLQVLRRLPKVLLWNWLNVLLFDIANQRLPQSMLEDTINKSWRPLPAKRISTLAARQTLLGVVPLVFTACYFLGGVQEAVLMMVLGWMYNDLGGADENYNIRNAINALGFMCYSSGSLKVAVGFGCFDINQEIAGPWILIIGAMVFSTLSLQDMPDIAGDRIRGRKTLPLTYGESFARWAIAIPISLWSFICPMFWNLSVEAYIIPVGVGLFLALRVITRRDNRSDKMSWRLWCVWTMILYALPLVKAKY